MWCCLFDKTWLAYTQGAEYADGLPQAYFITTSHTHNNKHSHPFQIALGCCSEVCRHSTPTSLTWNIASFDSSKLSHLFEAPVQCACRARRELLEILLPSTDEASYALGLQVKLDQGEQQRRAGQPVSRAFLYPPPPPHSALASQAIRPIVYGFTDELYHKSGRGLAIVLLAKLCSQSLAKPNRKYRHRGLITFFEACVDGQERALIGTKTNTLRAVSTIGRLLN